MAHPLMVKVVFTGAMVAAIYRSLKALKSKDKEYSILMFWVVYGLLCVFEDNFEYFVQWVPFYFFVKFYFVIAISIPETKIANLMFYAIVIPGMEFLHRQLQHWQPPPLVTILFAPLLLMIQIVLPTLGQPTPEHEPTYKPLHTVQTPPAKPPRPATRSTRDLDTPPAYPPPAAPTSKRRRSGSSRRASPSQPVLEAQVESIASSTTITSVLMESGDSISLQTNQIEIEQTEQTVTTAHPGEEDSEAQVMTAEEVFAVLRASSRAREETPRRKTLPPLDSHQDVHDQYRTPQKSEADRAKLIKDSSRRLTEFSMFHNLRTPSTREREMDDEEPLMKQPLQRKNALSPESIRDSMASFMDLNSPAPNTLARRQTRQNIRESGGPLRRVDRGIPDLKANRGPPPPSEAPPVRMTRAQQLRDKVLRRRPAPPAVSPTPSASSSVEPSPRRSRRFSLSRKGSASQDDGTKKRAWL